MIAKNRSAKTELQKTREIKAILENSDDVTRQRLMRDFGEFNKLIDYLDEDQQSARLLPKLGDYEDFKLTKNAALTVNELAAQIVRESTGIQDVTMDNIEQLYNPIYSGYGSLASQRVNLIS